LEQAVRLHIRENGGFAIQKSSGLFWAGGVE